MQFVKTAVVSCFATNGPHHSLLGEAKGLLGTAVCFLRSTVSPAILKPYSAVRVLASDLQSLFTKESRRLVDASFGGFSPEFRCHADQ